MSSEDEAGYRCNQMHRKTRHFARRVRKSTAYRYLTLPQRIAKLWLVRRSYDQVIVHNARLIFGVPSKLLFQALCSGNRGRFETPPNLTIVLVHNRPHKTLMELSLDYLGVDSYVVLRTPPDQPWTHTTRITKILEYLESGACTTQYVLSTDCDDALLRDDPAKTIELLRAAGCEMLVSSSSYKLYRNMPQVREQTEALAPISLQGGKRQRIHLNAGVYIATASFLKEYLHIAAQYVTDNDFRSHELIDVSDEELRRILPDFPRGFGSDQAIMRLLFPRFYPRMQIDYAGRLALR
jgi:hypothetical protein